MRKIAALMLGLMLASGVARAAVVTCASGGEVWKSDANGVCDMSQRPSVLEHAQAGTPPPACPPGQSLWVSKVPGTTAYQYACGAGGGTLTPVQR